MNKEQLIRIAKAGFSDRIKDRIIDLDNSEIHVCDNVYRIYDPDSELGIFVPSEYYLAVILRNGPFVQFISGIMEFNQYAALKEMEKLNLI